MGPGTSYYSLSLWSPVPGPVPLVQLVKASPRLLRISRAMAAFRDAPPKEAFTRREWPIIRRCRSPEQVQRFLRSLPYNWERGGDTLRSFREVVRRGTAQCLEAALVAAVILEQHGYPPLVVSFESKDGIDHVIYVFRRRGPAPHDGGRGQWGSVARSRDAGLHGRMPVFRTIRDLVWSYFDPYVDFTGRITGYQLVDLRKLGRYDWRFSRQNMWKVEKFLLDIPHRRLRSSDRRYKKLHERYKEYRKRDPTGPVIDIYSHRDTWMALD